MSVAQLQNSYVNAEGGSTSALPYITWNPAYPGRPTTVLNPTVDVPPTGAIPVSVAGGGVPIYCFAGQKTVIVGTVQIATLFNNLQGDIYIQLIGAGGVVSYFVSPQIINANGLVSGSYYTITVVGEYNATTTGVVMFDMFAYYIGTPPIPIGSIVATASSIIAYAETV